MGSVWAFIAAVGIVLVWLGFGPRTHYSELWQILINTGTTIVTFLMVFLIQNTQNRDSKAIHLKLDELIRAVHGARNHMLDLENCTEEELDDLQKEFERLRRKAVARKKRGLPEEAPEHEELPAQGSRSR